MTFLRDHLPDWHTYAGVEGLTLKHTARAKWGTTECRFHGGSDSMRVHLSSGGWCCMNCGTKGGDVLAYHMQMHGLEFTQAARALGAWADDGKPPAHYKPAPLPARTALQVLEFEATLAAVAAANVAHGLTLSEQDKARLLTASSRISRIVEAYQ